MKVNITTVLKTLVVLMLFCLVGVTKLRASHIEGGNLTYRCLGGNQYEISLALYRDCEGASAPTSISIQKKSVTCGINTSIILTKIAGTGVECTPICPGAHTYCTNGNIPGVQEYIYRTITTLPACSDWVLSFSIGNRNAAITTITNPSAQTMYIEARLNNLAFPCNNSPQFTNRPVPFICVGQPFCYNNGSSDADGDSLSYTLVTPRTSATANVNYLSGYSATQPLSSSPPTAFNPATGDVCVSPTALQVSVFAVLVKEWRNGVLVGSVMRDIQIRTMTCTNNTPSLNGINNTGVYTKNACAGVPLTFNIPSFDLDNLQNVTLTWNSGITGATFNPGTGSRPTGVFSWTPTLADAGSVAHCFTVTVKDNYCPFSASQTYAFCITVGGFTATTTSTNAICNSHNGKASVTVSDGATPFTYTWAPSGGSGPNATNLAAGTYTCTVADAAGCSIAYPITVNLTNGGTASISSFSNISCNGANDGSVTVSITGATTPPLTYAWTPSSAGTTANVTNLGPGTYSVTVTDANGCTTSASQVIAQPAALTVSKTFTNVGCFGDNTGTATATANGGTGPYTYLWLPGAYNTASIGSLTIGTYTVQVHDAHGCSASTTANIVQPPALAITSTSIPASCGIANGSASVTGTGGFAPYTWTWSNGQTGASATALTAGTYTVTITDLNSCTSSTPVTVPSLAALTASIISHSDVSCFGGSNGNATVNVAGGAMPVTYLWNNAQTTPTASNLSQGIYSVSATDATGCVASASIVINEPPVLDANAVSSNPLCFGNADGTATSSAIGGTQPYSYVWTSPGSPTTSSITGLSAGTYSVTVTDAKACVQTASVTLTNPPTLATTITSTNVNCFNACDGTATAAVTNGTPPYNFLWSNPAAQTTPTASNLCNGTFTVSVTDNNNCPSQGVVTITQPTVLNAQITAAANLTCYGVCTGFAQVAASGGTPPYTYNWMPGSIASATASNLCAGSYTCTITDAKGCTFAIDTTITQPDQLIAAVSGTNINCFGACDGTANIAFSGGTAPYTALWTPSMQAVFNPANLCVGTHLGKVIDANGCKDSGSVVLTTANPQLNVSFTITNSNCGHPDGAACAIVSGGVAPYDYLWNDPNVSIDSCISAVVAGTYNVQITDASGCILTQPANINDASSPTITIVSHTDLLCHADSNATATITITGGVFPFTYVWTPSGQTAQNPQTLGGGVNTVTATDAAGCVSSKSLTVIEPTSINHAISSVSNISCYGVCDGAATAVAFGGTGALSFHWDDPALQATATASGLCVGKRIITITDANACSTTDSVQITQPNQLLIASDSVSNVLCYGDSNGIISVNITGGTPYYIYQWSPSGGSAPIEGGLHSGNDTVIVTDQHGCNTTQHWQITQPPVLTNSTTSIPTNCGQANGTAATTAAGGSPPYTYQWNDPQVSTIPVILNVYAGTYQITVTDSHQCTTGSNVVVNDIAGPAVDTMISSAVLCNGGSTGKAAVTTVSGVGVMPFTYGWTPSGQTADSLTNAAQGTYSVTVTDAKGCTAVGVINVAEPAALQLFVSLDDTICFNDTAQIYATASGGTQGYSYSWLGSTGTGLVGAGPHMVILTTGTTYSVMVTDTNGCATAAQSIHVIVQPPLTMTASDTAVCVGDSATIHAIVSGGDSVNYAFVWDNAITSQFQTLLPASGVTSVNYIVTVSDGCSSPISDTSTITVNPGSVVSFQGLPNSGCAPLTVNFTAQSDNGITYFWNFGNGESGTGAQFTHTYDSAGVYDVSLTATTSLGCNTMIDSIAYITVNNVPVADFTTELPIIAPVVNFQDLSGGAISNWFWNFGDITSTNDTSSSQNPSYQYAGAGSDSVTLIVTNQYGCKDTIAHLIDIIDEFTFYAPNGFSPNDDGLNDVFAPKAIAFDPSTFNMMIFDRWGNLIYVTTDYNKGWDGRANKGKDIAQIDTYVWKISLKDNKGNRHSYIGSVSILK